MNLTPATLLSHAMQVDPTTGEISPCSVEEAGELEANWKAHTESRRLLETFLAGHVVIGRLKATGKPISLSFGGAWRGDEGIRPAPEHRLEVVKFLREKADEFERVEP